MTKMTKIAWVFPGQGSQALDMHNSLLEIPLAQQRFEEATKILGWSVVDICQGDEAKLSQTLYTQPCLYVVESILVDLISPQAPAPSFLAGHSLGEYVALYAAKVWNFTTGLKLVKKRAELMSQAVGGKMTAMMKFDRQELEKVVAATPGVVIANDNSPQQVVISGTSQGVEEVKAKVKAKRMVDLKVSGAFHSPLMQEAATNFASILEETPFAEAQIPIISNVAPVPTTEAQELKKRLREQMTGSVRWREIVEQLPQLGVNKVVEIGPGKVLTGLVKKTCAELEVQNINQIHEFAY